jgi:pilus assembly protein CpaF
MTTLYDNASRLAAAEPDAAAAAPPQRAADANQLAAVDAVHVELLERYDLAAVATLSDDDARRTVAAAARAIVSERLGLSGAERDTLVDRVVDEVVGLGPIDVLLRDPAISEVMVNAPDQVYFERDGVIEVSQVRFRDAAHILRIIDRITASVGRRVDEASPMVDARLADGSRVNAAIPPVIPRGPVLTIRKFRHEAYRLSDLVRMSTLTAPAAGFLAACVRLRLNILVSGGTGSGKTTLLNALSEHLPERERIVTIEDPAELRLQQEHVIAMEARPANIEGKHAITQRDLFRNALRMRPDRIVVGEVRGAEAFDMMQAMNTGHDGSLTTVHANSARDALSRIENMVLMSGYELPVRAIREQIGSALQLVVHVARLSDGTRRVTQVAEITGLEGQVVTMQDILLLQVRGIQPDGAVQAELRPTGLMPTFAERFQTMGIRIADFLTEEATRRWT